MTYTKEQQRENRKKWVEALRSGKYKQGTGLLFDGEKYCCLGVLCEVAKINRSFNDNGFFIYGDSEAFASSPEAMNFVGLETESGSFWSDNSENHLTRLNDDGATFSELADIIESEPEGLFND